MTDVYLSVYLFIWYHVYLILLSKNFFSYSYTIFKLILFQYDTSLSNNFCGIFDKCGLLILKQPSFMVQ